MKSLVAPAIRSHAGLPAPRRSLARLRAIAPAVLLLSGLFTVWAGPLAAPVAAASGDWTQFRNGPTHQGYNTAESTISAENVDALGVAWMGATGRIVNSSPVASGGSAGPAPTRRSTSGLPKTGRSSLDIRA